MDTPYHAWSNISQHILNAIFAFLEILLPASEPHPWLQMAPMIVVLALYLALAYVTHATQGWYVYDFLDIRYASSHLAKLDCANVCIARQAVGW